MDIEVLSYTVLLDCKAPRLKSFKSKQEGNTEPQEHTAEHTILPNRGCISSSDELLSNL